MRAGVLGLLAIAAVVGATADGPADRPAPARAATERRGDEAALQQAQALLVAGCMRRRGFPDYPTPDEPAAPGPPDAPYGQFDVRWARAHGYGSDLEAALEAAERRNPVHTYVARLAPVRRDAAMRAVNGAAARGLEVVLPGGGVIRRSATSCASRADDRLYGDMAAWFRASRIRDNLRSTVVARVLGDRRYKAAVARWSRCMRRSGHPARTPVEARERALADPRIEVATAVAEATCARRTRLAATARALDRARRREVRADWGHVLTAHARMRRAAVARARKLIARSSSPTQGGTL